MANCETSCLVSNCSPENDIVLRIFPRTIGGTLVQWEIPTRLDLTDNATYQLQHGRAGQHTADDWVNVGIAGTNKFFQIDSEYRNIGQARYSYYRVVVIDGASAYYSLPYYCDAATLKPSHLRMYTEIVRREQARYRDRQTPALKGFLLKKRRHGPVCPECSDPQTGQRIKEHCSTCYGAGFTFGYYAPYPCFYVDLTNTSTDIRTELEQGVTDLGHLAEIRFLDIPHVDPGDVWVSASSDYRWMIGAIADITKVDHLAIVRKARAARLPFNHVVYDIEV
jgi:hypothetical protein